MLAILAHFVIGTLLVAEALITSHVVRETLQLALQQESRRSAPIGLRTVSDDRFGRNDYGH
jgi:hypothetical protein